MVGGREMGDSQDLIGRIGGFFAGRGLAGELGGTLVPLSPQRGMLAVMEGVGFELAHRRLHGLGDRGD